MSQPTPCLTCGALLAPDQRYCLSCGTRVAAPRLDFVAESERAEAEARAGSAPTPQTPVQVAIPAPSRLDKVGGPMGVAAVVLVALGIGFLIGQSGIDKPPEQKAPVVNIEGGLPTQPQETAPPIDGDTEATTNG